MHGFTQRGLSILALLDRYGMGKDGFKDLAALLRPYLVGL